MNTGRPHLVGINHVALEVDDLERAVDFYRDLFELRSVEREPGMAFLDMGDQFLALSHTPGEGRHFGLVVDDKRATRAVLKAQGVEVLPGRRLDFLDPWGNRIQVVDYRDIQFTKVPAVMHAMGLEHLRKRTAAIQALRSNGLA